MTHICVSKFTIIGSDNGWLAPSHYLSQCWNIINWTLRNKRQWNPNQNLYIFIQENGFENVVWKMAAILSRPQCVIWQLVLDFFADADLDAGYGEAGLVLTNRYYEFILLPIDITPNKKLYHIYFSTLWLCVALLRKIDIHLKWFHPVISGQWKPLLGRTKKKKTANKNTTSTAKEYKSPIL